MLTKSTLASFLLIIYLLINGCHNRSAHNIINADPTGQIKSLSLADREIEWAGIKYSAIHKMEMPKQITLSGHLQLVTLNQTSISSPAAGTIVSIFCWNGELVEEGDKLAGIQNTDFIMLQRDYLEAVNQFDYFKEEFTRQGDLTVENATSIKKMQIARRDYQSAELRANALKLQLKILGICPDSVKTDRLVEILNIRAPHTGVVSGISARPGNFVEKGHLLMELGGKQRFSIEFHAPEQYLKSISAGKVVTCYPAYDSLIVFDAVIRSIGAKINPDTHETTVYAEPVRPLVNFIPGMSIKISFVSQMDTLCLVSHETILTEPGGNFVFVKHAGRFLKMPVNPGNLHGPEIEITGLPQGMTDSVVVSGIENLNSFFKIP